MSWVVNHDETGSLHFVMSRLLKKLTWYLTPWVVPLTEKHVLNWYLLYWVVSLADCLAFMSWFKPCVATRTQNHVLGCPCYW